MSKLPMFGYLGLLASLFTFIFYFFMHRGETAKKAWPSVPGKIISDATVVRTQRARVVAPSTGRTVRSNSYNEEVQVWALEVECHYDLAGQEYRAASVTSTNHADELGDFPQGPSPQMLEWKAQLTKGKTIPVHYDPHDPQESYIFYSESPGLVTILKTAFILAILGVVLIIAPRLL